MKEQGKNPPDQTKEDEIKTYLETRTMKTRPPITYKMQQKQF